MNLSLHPYGPLVEVIGDAPQPFNTTAVTAQALLQALHTQYPELHAWKGRIALAVGEKLLSAEDSLSENDEVALIPPVSGG